MNPSDLLMPECTFLAYFRTFVVFPGSSVIIFIVVVGVAWFFCAKKQIEKIVRQRTTQIGERGVFL